MAILVNRGKLVLTRVLTTGDWTVKVGTDNSDPNNTSLQDLRSPHGRASPNTTVGYIGNTLQVQGTITNDALPDNIGEAGLFLDNILILRDTYDPPLSKGSNHIVFIWDVTVGD